MSVAYLEGVALSVISSTSPHGRLCRPYAHDPRSPLLHRRIASGGAVALPSWARPDGQHSHRAVIDQRFVVMGVAGAGKSMVGAVLAAALGVPFVEGDQLHPPDNVALMTAGTPLDDAHRAVWLRRIADRIHASRLCGEGVVVSCSALKRQYRDVLRDGDAEVRFIHLRGETALLRSRLESRHGHFMPASLLDSQLAALEPPDDHERAWVCDAGLPLDQIVAVLKAMVHGQHPAAQP